jgi:translation initiation factor 5B
MKLRSPVCCVLGHVDAGKTSLLDKLRTTNNQAKEAGGITQSISAWNLSIKDINTFIEKYTTTSKTDTQIPGLLMIDTPGHEAFIKLRTTGANLCDIAILVVDIHKGIEKQTIESINILKASKIPFIIACNKLDTLHGWKTIVNGCFKDNVDKQSSTTLYQLEKARNQLFLQFANIGMNVEFYHKNKDFKSTVNIVPISAITGEGIPDLLTVVMRICEKFMKRKIEFNEDQFKGLILKEERLQGHGSCIRTLLVNGTISKGTRVFVQGQNCDGGGDCEGQKTIIIKSLLIYNQQGELSHVNSVTAACACIIVPVEPIDGILPGSEILSKLMNNDTEHSTVNLNSNAVNLNSNDLVKPGVWGAHLQSDSIGTLDALCNLFSNSKFPVASYGTGPIYKTDLMKMNARCGPIQGYQPMIVNFGAQVTEEAQKFAKDNNIEILESPIIYRLLEGAIASHKQQQYKIQKQHEEDKKSAIFPCKLKIVGVYRASDPIIIGVKVEEGSLRIGTPLMCYKNNEVTEIGNVFQMKTPLGDTCESVDIGTSVSIEIRNSKKKAGIHFETKDLLYSNISRKSLDILKLHFKDDLTKSDIKCIIEIKNKINMI